jgi:hypothetical protein
MLRARSSGLLDDAKLDPALALLSGDVDRSIVIGPVTSGASKARTSGDDRAGRCPFGGFELPCRQARVGGGFSGFHNCFWLTGWRARRSPGVVLREENATGGKCCLYNNAN